MCLGATSYKSVLPILNKSFNIFDDYLRFFDSTVSLSYLPTLQKHFKVACAISNAYFPPLATECSNWEHKAELTLCQFQKSNALAERVKSENWLTRKVNWQNVNETFLPSFP